MIAVYVSRCDLVRDLDPRGVAARAAALAGAPAAAEAVALRDGGAAVLVVKRLLVVNLTKPLNLIVFFSGCLLPFYRMDGQD